MAKHQRKWCLGFDRCKLLGFLGRGLQTAEPLLLKLWPRTAQWHCLEVTVSSAEEGRWISFRSWW